MLPALAIPLTAAGTGLVYVLARWGTYVRSGRTPTPSPSPAQPSRPVPPPPPSPTEPPDDEHDEPSSPTAPTNEDPGPAHEPVEPPAPAPEPPHDPSPELPTPPTPQKLSLEQLVAQFMGARTAECMAWLASTLGAARMGQLANLVAALPAPPSFDALCTVLGSAVNQVMTAAESQALVTKFPEWRAVLEKCAIMLRTVEAPLPAPAPEPERPIEPPPPGPTNEDPHDEPGPAEEPTEPPAPTPAPPPDPSPELPTPAPEPTPAPGPTPPAGFNWQHAAELAPAVANNLVQRGISNYDRARLKAWQSLAGIDVDGVYGGETRGALVHYLDDAVPKAFFKPVATQPYKWASLVPKGAGLEYSKRGAPPAPTPADVEPEHDDVPAGPPSPAPAPPPDNGESAAEVGPVPPEGFDPDKARKMAKQVANNLDVRGRDKYDRKQLAAFQLAAGIDADGIYGGQSRGALIFYGVKRPPNAFFKPTATQPYQWAEQAGGGAP